jgi:hypothetical protein
MHYFLVYNDYTHVNYLNNLIRSVEKYGSEFKIVIFDKSQIDSEFVERNKHILECHRGGGYWLWKPYIINAFLKNINDNDIVFYLDSKYLFIENFITLYSDFMLNNDILIWKNKPNGEVYYMKNWCKMDVICKYGMYDKAFNENAVESWAGALIVKKNEFVVWIIQEWLDMCCNYDDISDSPSQTENSSMFIEHRHDQSMLSIVLHKYNIQMQFFETKYLQDLRNPHR